MVQVAIEDTLISKARSLIDDETNEAIVTAALEAWITAKENQIDLEQYRGKLHWDSEFVGIDQMGAQQG